MTQEAAPVEQIKDYTLHLNVGGKIEGKATINNDGNEIRLASPKPNPHPLTQLRELARKVNFGKHGKSIQMCVAGNDHEWQVVIRAKNGTPTIDYLGQNFKDKLVIK